MSDEIERRTFGKRFLGGLAALMAAPFVKSKITHEEWLKRNTPSTAELKKIVEQNPPPPEWYEGEEYPFDWSHTIKYENGRTECYRNGKLVSVTELSDRGVGTF